MNSLHFQPQTRWLVTVILLFALSISNAWGETLVLTFNGTTNAYSLVTTASTSQSTFTQGTTTLGYKSCVDGSNAGKHYIQFNKGAGVLYNTTAIPGNITNIKVEYRDGTSEKSDLGVKCGTSKIDSRQTESLDATLDTDGGSYDDCDFEESNGFTYFNLSVQGGTGNSYGNIQVTKITITYTAASTCSTPPTVAAPNKGSISVTGATVSCTGITKGDCDIDEWGFFYKTGSSGVTTSDTKVQVSAAKSTTNVSSFNKSFTELNPNTHYYFAAYAKVGSTYYLSSETDFTTKTLTSSSSNTTYGTVSRSGRVITGSLKSGGSYGSPAYTVTGASGGSTTTVEREGNRFTVTSNSTSNITVTINFEAKGCTDHGASSITSTSGGNSYTYGPVSDYHKYSTRQILYTKSDLGLSSSTKKGTIKSIYFYYKHTAAMTKKTDVKIYMANTYLSSLSTSSNVPYSEFTQVYSGSLNCTATNDWNEFMLDEPFDYNGAGNLVVMIDDDSGGYDGSSYTFYYHAASGAQIYTNSDYTNDDPSTTDWSEYTAASYRPSTKFCIEESDMVQYTVNWYVNGSIAHSQTGYAGTTLTSIPAPDESDCDGEKVFVGWYTNTYSHATNAPAYVSPTTIPEGGANYYAVFATTTTNYKIATKADLLEGTKVVLVNGTNAVSSSVTTTDKLDPVSISSKLSDGVIANPGSNIIWTVALDGTKYKFKQGSNYLNAVSGSGSAGKLYCNATSDSWLVNTSSTNYYYLQSTNASNRKLEYFNSLFTAYNGTVNSDYYINFYVQVFTDYATSCCEKLGSVSATNSAKTGTTANFTWSEVTGAESYKVKVPGSSSHNDWTTATSGVSVTGLTAGNSYTAYFKAFDSNGSHCAEGPESTIEFTTPKITLGSASGTSTYNEGSGPGSKQTFTVTAVGLTGNLTVTAPTNFAVCATESGSYTSSITLTPTSGAVSTTVYFQLVAGKTAAASPYAGNVTVSGGSATEQTVAVNGTVNQACADPTITAQPAPSASYNLNVSAAALSVTATKNGTGPALTYQWYSNTANSKTTPAPTAIDEATSSSYAPPTTATGTKYYFCEVSSGACAVTTDISTITVNTPSITVSKTSIAFGDQAKDGSHTETFTVSGTNLASGTGLTLAVTGSSYFTIDQTSVAQTSDGTVATTTITVTYAPTVIGDSHSATITVSSTGAENKTVTLSGNSKYQVTWIDEAASATTYSYVASGKPTFPSNPTGGCDTYTYFYGWAEGTFTTPVTAPGTSSAIKVYKSASEMPNVSGNVTYYAVWSNAAPTDYSTTYTSNVTLPTSGTYVYSANVTISGNNYSGAKIGKSGDAGSSSFTVPSGTKKIFLHTVNWYNEDNTLTLSSGTLGVTISPSGAITPPRNSGMEGSDNDFTLATLDGTQYKEYNLTGVSSAATINVSSTSRLLVWGINATSSTGEGNCVTSCCEEVTARSGSVSTESTSATVSWTVSGTAASKIGSWDVTCSPAGTKGSITGTTTKSVEFTGLTPNTAYTFHILGTSNDAAYCDVDDELTGTTECLTPSSLSISSTGNKWDFCADESMTLTVNGTNVSANATYQWQKHNGSTWVDIDGATSASYTVASMAASNAGQYRCTVTNPGSGSCDATTDGVWVRVWQLHLGDDDIDFTYVSGTTGSNSTVHLNSDTHYEFKLKDNNGGWFGLNDKTITATISAFALNGSDANVNVTSGLEGNYTFTINYSDKNNPTIAVTYPVGNQPSGRKIWFDKSVVTGWNSEGTSDLYYRIGKSTNHTNNTKTGGTAWTLVPGTDKFYTTKTMAYDGFEAWAISNNAAWCADADDNHSIYGNATDGYKITKAIDFQKYVVGASGVTIVPTAYHNTDGNSCDYWSVTKTDGMLTHTATITPPTNGTITIANAAQSLEETTTTADLPHRTILTVTATPAPGYQLSSLTVNGEAFTSGSEYILSADATIAATFTAKTITITWDGNGGNTPSPTESSYTYNGSTVSLATVTHATKLFAGWFTDPSAGTQITEIGTTSKPTADVTYYAHWVDGNTVIFHPGVGSVTPASVTQTSIGGAVDIPTPIIDCDGWSFAGWNIGSTLAETTTNPEASLQAAGSAAYVPASVTVHMYAVWKKNFGGGTGTIANTYNWDDTNNTWSTNSMSAWVGDSNTSPHSGTKCGSNSAGGAYIYCLTKATTPDSLVFYYTKSSTNTTSSNKWHIQTSSDGSSWTTIESTLGNNSLTRGTWVKYKFDMTSYSNKYVRLLWSNESTASGGTLDDVTFYYEGTTPDAWKWTSSANDYGCTPANQVKTPLISPDTEAQTGDVSVTITCATDDATIRYTTDGTDPSSSTGTVYSGAFTVSCSATVKAIAYKATMDDSEIAEQEYTVTVPTPTFSLAEGTYYDANQSVTLSLPTAHTGTVIKYTTNGDDPTSSSATYSSAITVTEGTTTIKAIGYNATCGTSSSVASATYIVRFGTDYTLVTDANDLMAGDQVVIISADAGTSSKYAISTTISSNKRTSTGDYNINAGLTTATIYPAVGAAATVQVFTLGGEPGAWTFHETTNNGYLNCPSAGKLTNTANVSNSNKWTIAIASNIATIHNNDVDATIKSNTSAGHVFAAYAPATENVQLVKLYSIPNPDPVIKIDADLSAFSACRGSASEYQSFYISGKNLDGNIVLSNVAPLDGYEFCLTSGGTYTATLELTPVSKTVAKTQVFVRLAAGATAGTKNGNLNAAVSANSLSTNIAVTGSVSTADTYTDQIHNTVVTNQCGEYLAPSCPDASAPADESCVETHFKFMGWITEADKNASGVKDDAWYIAHLVTAGTAMTADGTNYYAVWAKEED